MKTRELINALIEDQEALAPAPGLGSPFGFYLAGGLAFSLLIFFSFLGIRSDFDRAMLDPHVVFKFIFAGSLFGSLIPLAFYAMRPEITLTPLLRRLFFPLIVLGMGIAFQMATTPPDFWFSEMVGRYPASCLKNVPIFAAGPLVAILLMIRAGAPTQPIVSGAIAGALSGSLGAIIYALHCPDDSALFVAVWYSLAIGILSVVGGFLGHLWLKW